MSNIFHRFAATVAAFFTASLAALSRSLRASLFVRRSVNGVLLALPILFAGACEDSKKVPKTGIYLNDAYIKTAVPGRSMTAAYATFTNHDAHELCLVYFSAAFAASIELHTTEPVGDPAEGRVAMRRLPELCLAPGASVELTPGGKHLMVMGLDPAALVASSTVGITLGTRGGRAFEGQFRVQPFSQ